MHIKANVFITTLVIASLLTIDLEISNVFTTLVLVGLLVIDFKWTKAKIIATGVIGRSRKVEEL